MHIYNIVTQKMMGLKKEQLILSHFLNRPNWNTLSHSVLKINKIRSNAFIKNFYFIYVIINYVCLFIRFYIQFHRYTKFSLFLSLSLMQFLLIRYILYINIQIFWLKIHHISDCKTTDQFPKSLLNLKIVLFFSV